MNPFRKSSLRFSDTPIAETPYQKASQVWDRRMGEARVQARNWRLAALVSIGALTLATADNLRQRLGAHVVPYVVEVDKLGEARSVAPVTDGYRPTDPQIAWHLARFVEHMRSVPADPVVLKASWLSAYDFVTARGAAALNDYARVNDPFGQVGETQVAVDISSVIRASPDSFRVAWVERRYASGQLASTTRWSAILTIIVQTPRTASALERNPLGIFVDSINWAREMGDPQ